jgi:hypothetical protein
LENVTPLFNSLLMYDARGSTSQLSFKLIKCLHYKKKILPIILFWFS